MVMSHLIFRRTSKTLETAIVKELLSFAADAVHVSRARTDDAAAYLLS